MNNKEIKKLLLESIKNNDLKMAVADAPLDVFKNGQWIDNPFFAAMQKSAKRAEMLVSDFNERGLYYANKDLYIYLGRGGIKVEETPKGIRKMLLYLSEKYERRIVISDGVLYRKDKVSLTTDGLIDDINIVRDTTTMLNGGDSIVAPYAITTILSNRDKVVTKKFIVMPNYEYKNALKQAGGVKDIYPSMMATKMVMKRALTQVYSLLGTGIESDDLEDMDNAIENQNIDGGEEQSEEPQMITKEQVSWLEKTVEEDKRQALMKWLKTKRIERYEDITADVFVSIQKKLDAKFEDE